MSQSGALSAAGGGGIDLLELTGDTGGVVHPDINGNINIIGGTGVTVDGDPGTNTLTININGTSEATVTTTDATPTLLAAIPVASNEAAEIEVSVIAPQSTYASAIGGKLTCIARNAGAGAIVVGAPQGNLIYDSAGAPALTFVASGSNININVTGVAATTFNWLAAIKVIYN